MTGAANSVTGAANPASSDGVADGSALTANMAASCVAGKRGSRGSGGEGLADDDDHESSPNSSNPRAHDIFRKAL